MKKFAFVFFIIIFIIVGFILPVKIIASEDEITYGKVVYAEQITEQDGIKYQKVKVQLSRGEYKGNVIEIKITFNSTIFRPVKEGDMIKVKIVDINGDKYFQFYDFVRIKGYLFLLGLFIVLAFTILEWKGIRTLLPSICFILLVILGIIPDLFSRLQMFELGILVITLITIFTSLVQTRNRKLTFIVTFSVILCLIIGLIVFLGFSNISYIVPFAYSLPVLEENLNIRIFDIIFTSILVIPAGGVINASIQVAKYISEELFQEGKFDLSILLKEGFRVSKKVSSGELNNLVTIIVGISLPGIYLIKQQNLESGIWDNGWIALQIIYILSSCISLLLISPVTVIVFVVITLLTKTLKSTRYSQRKYLLQSK